MNTVVSNLLPSKNHAAAAAAIVFAVVSAALASPPNVLLIMTDDQGYGDFSIHGHPYLKTPNIDGIAESGTRFDRFYVSSYCAPTRAALLTGRYPERCGVWGVALSKEAMRPREVTSAETLQRAGYRTACIGKWHLGEQYPYTPPGQGFDEFFGIWNGHTNNYFDATLIRGAKPERTHGYIADVLTDEAIHFIKENRERPFFCYLSYNTPHSPYQVSDRYFDKFAAQGLSPKVSAYFGMCENIDDNVGRLLTALKDANIDNNTIVLFLTDNGGTTATEIHNAGMRDGKTSVHEGGCRVPLFIRWPARYPNPRTIDNIASHVDVYPTLLDLCGVATPSEQPPLDGMSLRPLLDGSDADWPNRILFTHNPISEKNRYPGAVRTDQYRLVRDIAGPGGGSLAVENDRSATPWQLYDTQDDPGESKDLVGQRPDIVKDLSQRYEAWLDEVLHDGLERPPIPVGYQQQNPVTLQAHQAYFDKGIGFSAGNGFAHDFLTRWTDSAAKIWFDVDAHVAGAYEVALLYGCSASNAGSTIQVSANSNRVQGSVVAAEAPIVQVPHRDEADRRIYVIREWARLPLGVLKLAAGRQRLSLEVVDKRGEAVMDFKGVELLKLN